MYGMNGTYSALQWADEFGFFNVTKKDQEELISSGHYTVDGHRILLPEEKCPDSSHASTPCHIDIRV